MAHAAGHALAAVGGTVLRADCSQPAGACAACPARASLLPFLAAGWLLALACSLQQRPKPSGNRCGPCASSRRRRPRDRRCRARPAAARRRLPADSAAAPALHNKQPCLLHRCRLHSTQDSLPWEALLTDEEVQRAEGYYGTGARMRRVAAKLLAGEPIQVRAGLGLRVWQQRAEARLRGCRIRCRCCGHRLGDEPTTCHLLLPAAARSRSLASALPARPPACVLPTLQRFPLLWL